jgi:uncharacterized protein (TIGR03435 family)
MMRVTAILSVVAFVNGAAFGQKPTFEVASVKHVDPASRASGGFGSTGVPPPITGDPGLINYSDVTLKGVLARAYQLKPNQIAGPDWLNTERYNITARVARDAPKGQIPAMLQNLLADRFRMTVRWEMKEVQGLALTVGKAGAKLTKSAVPEADAATERSSGFSTSGHLTFRASTLDDFAGSLAIFMRQPVVDMTDIEGMFDITLDASPDSMPGLPSGESKTDASPLPSIFTAIRGLGLNLEARKVSVRRLVVESANKIPTDN